MVIIMARRGAKNDGSNKQKQTMVSRFVIAVAAIIRKRRDYQHVKFIIIMGWAMVMVFMNLITTVTTKTFGNIVVTIIVCTISSFIQIKQLVTIFYFNDQLSVTTFLIITFILNFPLPSMFTRETIGWVFIKASTSANFIDLNAIFIKYSFESTVSI